MNEVIEISKPVSLWAKVASKALSIPIEEVTQDQISFVKSWCFAMAYNADPSTLGKLIDSINESK